MKANGKKTNGTDKNTIITEVRFERETKGAVLYVEDLAEGDDGIIRSQYIRKSVLGEAPYPARATVTIEFKAA